MLHFKDLIRKSLEKDDFFQHPFEAIVTRVHPLRLITCGMVLESDEGVQWLKPEEKVIIKRWRLIYREQKLQWQASEERVIQLKFNQLPKDIENIFRRQHKKQVKAIEPLQKNLEPFIHKKIRRQRSSQIANLPNKQNELLERLSSLITRQQLVDFLSSNSKLRSSAARLALEKKGKCFKREIILQCLRELK